MSYGIIQSGRTIKNEALQGLSQVARNDQQREMTNKGLKDAKRQQEISSTLGGAMTGAMLGSKVGTIGGPMGMALGALAGWALS